MSITSFTQHYPDVFASEIFPHIQPIDLYNLCKTTKTIPINICSSINNYIIQGGITTIDCIDIESRIDVLKKSTGLPDIATFTRYNDLFIY